MALTMYDIRRIMRPSTMNDVCDDIRIIDSWTEYGDDPNKAAGKQGLKYMCYEMETMNPATNERKHFYKAVKFLKIERLPASARQSTAFMDMQSQILASVWENGYNMVTVVANILRPVSIGLLYLYGVQGVSHSLEEAKKKADMDFRGLRASLQGTFRVLEMRVLFKEEAEWLRERIAHMRFLTTVRGIPKAGRTGEDAGNKGMGGKNVNPDSQGTLEELITGLADYEYVIEVLSTPVYRDTLEGWQRKWQKEMTEWNSKLQGTASLNMNLSIPMTHMANISQAQGWSRSFNDSTMVSSSLGESFVHSEGTSIGKSLSESYSKGVSYSEGTSFTQNESQGFSISNGINKSHSIGESVGESFSTSTSMGIGRNVSISSGENTGYNEGLSRGTNVGMNDSTSRGLSSGVNLGSSHGINTGINESVSHGQSSGMSASHSSGTSENMSRSMGISESTGYSQNAGVSSGSSYSYGQGVNESTSYGQNVGHSATVGHNESFGQNYGYTQNQSASMSNSVSVGQSASQGISNGVTNTYGNGQSYSASNGYSNQWSNGGSETYSDVTGKTEAMQWSLRGGLPVIGASAGGSTSYPDTHTHAAAENWSNSGGQTASEAYSANMSESHSATAGSSASVGQSSSLGASIGYSSGNSVSVGASASEGYTESQGISMGESFGASSGHSQSESYGSTLGQSFSEGYSSSMGINQSAGYGVGISESDSVGVNTGSSDSVSAGVSYGESDSTSAGLSYGENMSVSNGTSFGMSDGSSMGSSYGQNISQSEGLSYSYSSSASYGQNHSVSQSDSYGQSYTEGQSYSQGQSYGQSISNGQSLGISQGTGQNWGSSRNDSHGLSASQSEGRSTGMALGTTGTSSFGTSTAMGLGPSIGYSKSHQWLDQGVKDLLELMEYQDNRLKEALKANGAFYTYVYICCPSEECMRAAQAVAKSTWQNPDAMIQPLQVLDLSEHEQMHLLHHAAAFSADITKEYNNGAEEFKYCSVLLPSEYAAYTHLPRVSEGGVFATIEDIPKFSIPGRLDGEIYMGNVLSTERYTWENGYNTPFDYRIPESALLHGYFTGASRSGKTVAAMRFIRELSEVRRSSTGKCLRIVVLDPKQDWRKLGRYVDPERFRFASMGNANFNPIRINPWKIPEGVDPQFWIDGVINIYCRAYGFLERGKQMISEVVFEQYDQAGVFGVKDPDTGRRTSVDMAKVPEMSAKVNFCSIYEAFKRKHAALAAKGNVMGSDTKDAYARILERLSAFGREYTIEYKLYGTSEGLGIDELIGDDDITVLESKGLESTFNNFIFGVVVSGFYKYALGHDGGFLAKDQYETVLVVEEANEVLTGNDDSSGKTSSGLKGESEFEQVLDQAAGYGLFIMAITQKIGKMPSSVTANAGIVFTGRLQTPTDVQAAMNAMGKDERIDDKDLKKWYPHIPVGWFIVKVSRSRDWKSQFPVLVNIAPLPGTVPNNNEISDILKLGRAIRESRALDKAISA